MADCPSCISYRSECYPDPEDHEKPCKFYENKFDIFKEEAASCLPEELEPCPHCGTRPIEIDDLGYYGCKKCMPEMSADVKARALDCDGTGQDWEIFGGGD